MIYALNKYYLSTIKYASYKMQFIPKHTILTKVPQRLNKNNTKRNIYTYILRFIGFKINIHNAINPPQD